MDKYKQVISDYEEARQLIASLTKKIGESSS